MTVEDPGSVPHGASSSSLSVLEAAARVVGPWRPIDA
jgi:hypothetical protein